jgi:hypothetical protein
VIAKLPWPAALACVAALGACTTALAAAAPAQANTYSAAWWFSPAQTGTRAAPGPVLYAQWAIDVASEPPGARPGLVSRYDFFFQGLHQGGAYFPRCSARQVLAGGRAACPPGALIGSGYADTQAGLSEDPTQKVPCRLALTAYNGPPGHLTIVATGNDQLLIGGFGGPRGCDAFSVPDLPIDASWTNDARGSHIAFRLDGSPLAHPQSDVDNALVHLQLKIAKGGFARVRGHRRYLTILQSFTCPRGRQLTFAAAFTEASGGPRSLATAFAPCG